MSHYLTIKGIGNPVAYFPRLGVFLDSVTAAVFLCQMIYWHDKATSEFGVYKSADEITEETGLTYREQATARKKLASLGLIKETNRRLEHRIYFKFDPDAFDEWLSGCLGIEIGERRKRISGDAENAIGRTTKTQFVIQENTQENTTENKGAHFDEFWKAYPNKKDKKRAEQKFEKINFKKYSLEEIMVSLDQLKRSDEWMKENGKYIPMASTWINGERWNDVLETIEIQKQKTIDVSKIKEVAGLW